MTILKFTTNSDISNWKIINDAVMGGHSNGNFKINAENYGEFSGKISLQNNGGFSSLHYYFKTKETSAYSKFVIKLKGDGNFYQFRVKDKYSNRHSYIYKFKTTQNWQILEIPFTEMYPAFRGNILELPNYNGKQMEAVAFLIGNKREQQFKLIVDSICLE